MDYSLLGVSPYLLTHLYHPVATATTKESIDPVQSTKPPDTHTLISSGGRLNLTSC